MSRQEGEGGRPGQARTEGGSAKGRARPGGEKEGRKWKGRNQEEAGGWDQPKD